MSKMTFPIPFTIETESIDNGKGVVKSTRVKIFHDGQYVGEYLRNYSSSAKSTFVPFLTKDHGWFALYSPDYTCTRLMKLPECKDIGGEEPAGNGFCPVEIYVPQFRSLIVLGAENTPLEERMLDTCFMFDNDIEESEEYDEDNYSEPEFAQWGFLCGCVWGDDISWKIRVIDLRKVHEGKLIIDNRFGYLEMPRGLKLRECLDFGCWFRDSPRVTITSTDTFEIETGEKFE